MSSPLDNSQAHLAAARGFARSLNILLKYARLYGLNHARTLSQVDAAWNELSGVLARAGDPGLLIGVAGDDLVVDGLPVGTGGAERAFAQLLVAAKVASLQFSGNTSLADFTRFAGAFAAAGKPADIAPALHAALGDQKNIRINEVRFVATGTNTPVPMMATQLAVAALGEKGERMQEWLSDPHKLLQLIAAAEASASGKVRIRTGDSGSQPAAVDDVTNEQELIGVIRVLAQLGESANMADGASVHDVLPTLPDTMHAALRHAAAAIAHDPQRPDDPMLVQLAEHLAIRFAVRRYERGEVKVNAVRDMLERMGKEISDLKRVLTAHEQKMSRAGMSVECYTDTLDRDFWNSIPDKNKRQVLLSDDTWCIPPRNITSYIEQLLGRGDFETARAILRRYSASIITDDAEGRRKCAIGLSEMAALYGQVDVRLLGTAIRDVAWQLRREHIPEIQQLLAATFVRLSREAATFHRYAAFAHSLDALEAIEKQMPQLGESLRPRVVAYDRIPDFVDTAVRSSDFPAELMRVLERLPDVTAQCLAERFSRTSRAQERERLVAIAFELGATAASHLCNQLGHAAAGQGIHTVGLLARLSPEMLENALPARVEAWGRGFHDTVVAQLALSGAPERGRLLMSLLPSLDQLVLPQAVDEIGMSGEIDAAGQIMAMALVEPDHAQSPYVQVKAIEALGRLRVEDAARGLSEIVRSRNLWRWAYPDEIRTAALQALASINPYTAESVGGVRGLDTAPMALPPTNDEWARQRRYVRVIPTTPCRGLASSPRISTSLDITSLSLTGGLATTDKRATSYRHAQLELPVGLRKIKAEVLMHDCGGRQVSFEIVDMGLEDRGKLRKFLAAQLAQQGPHRSMAAAG